MDRKVEMTCTKMTCHDSDQSVCLALVYVCLQIILLSHITLRNDRRSEELARLNIYR